MQRLCLNFTSSPECSIHFFLHLLTDQSDGGDQTKLVVGIVVGLLLATVIIGLAYWIYMKRSK